MEGAPNGKTGRWWVTALAVGVAALAIAACGGSDDSSDSAASTAAAPADTGAAPAGSTAAAAAGPKKVVAFIHGLQGLEYFNTAVCGAKKAAEENNVDLIIDASKQYDPTQQTTVIDNVLLKKPDGWVINPTDSVALNGLLAKIAAQAPLITWDGIPSVDVGIANIQTDGFKGGELGAEYMAEKLKGKKGYVLVLGTNPTTAQTVARSDGFIEKMRELSPDIEVSDTQYTGGSDAAVAARIVANNITAHPDMIGIFAPFEAAGNGASAALAAAKKDDVSLIAFDASPQQVENLRRGVFDALVVQAPFQQGFMTTDQMAKIVNGELDPATVTYKQYSPVNIATQENMDDPEIAQYLENPKC